MTTENILTIAGIIITLGFGIYKIHHGKKVSISKTEKYLREEYKKLLDTRSEEMADLIRNFYFDLDTVERQNNELVVEMKEWHRRYMNLCNEQWQASKKGSISEEYKEECYAKIRDAMRYPAHQQLWSRYTKHECFGTPKDNKEFQKFIEGLISGEG